MSTLDGQYVQVTGRIHIDGAWWTQAEVKQQVRRMGGDFVPKGSRNKGQTLVIAGELPSYVTDRKNRRSQNIVFVADERALGNHICLIDENGLELLLNGESATCIRLVETSRGIRVGTERSPRANGTTPVHALPPVDVLGTPLKIRRGPTHRPVQLTVDLDKLDRGSHAHEATRALLAEHLTETRVVEGTTPTLFDAGWFIAINTFAVAEVKSPR